MLTRMGIDQRTLELMYPRPERPRHPVERLACAVVEAAFSDLHSERPALRRDAQQFFRSDAFPAWASFTGLSVPAVRSRLVFLRLIDDDEPT